MVHLPVLIQDLAFILVTAAIVGLICKALKQPIVLGYLIAGMLLGSHVPALPTVVDTESIKIWAEIGVIFLLFGLGLEFSFKKLTQVGVSASITGIFEVIFMVGVGYAAGIMLGWTAMDSLFLGGILSISSTTIIVRAFDELGLKGRKFVMLVFGVLIVEDLVAILLLVLLSTVAVTQALSGEELLSSTAKLTFFVILWFVLGIYFLPIFLRKIRKILNDETRLIVSIGLCLLMVMVATKTGFSPALGAFVMGSLFAETLEGKTIEHLINPVKTLFAAVFFVSIGMLLDPKVIIENYEVILFLTVLTIVGKFISTVIGAVISGQSLKHSVQAGMSLAQIGEFSFIIATLGLSLKVINENIYPIAVAISGITTFTTPYLIKAADPFYDWLEKVLPKSFQDKISNYQNNFNQSGGQNILGYLWQAYGLKIILNLVIIVAIVATAKIYAMPMVLEKLGDHEWLRIPIALGILLACAPFLWALALSQSASQEEHKFKNSKMAKPGRFLIATIRLVLGTVLVAAITLEFLDLNLSSLLIFLGVMTIGFIFTKYSESSYKRIEERFLSNLEGESEILNDTENKRPIPQLAPWDAMLAEYRLSVDSPCVAKTLIDCALKEKFGVTVALIERGHKRIIAPSRNELLLPNDKLFLIGTDEQLAKAQAEIEVPEVDHSAGSEVYGLDSFILTEGSKFLGKSIRECGLREIVSGLIVGVERGGQRILNPDSALVLNKSDVIWLVGDKAKIKAIKSDS